MEMICATCDLIFDVRYVGDGLCEVGEFTQMGFIPTCPNCGDFLHEDLPVYNWPTGDVYYEA